MTNHPSRTTRAKQTYRYSVQTFLGHRAPTSADRIVSRGEVQAHDIDEAMRLAHLAVRSMPQPMLRQGDATTTIGQLQARVISPIDGLFLRVAPLFHGGPAAIEDVI